MEAYGSNLHQEVYCVYACITPRLLHEIYLHYLFNYKSMPFMGKMQYLSYIYAYDDDDDVIAETIIKHRLEQLR